MAALGEIWVETVPPFDLPFLSFFELRHTRKNHASAQNRHGACAHVHIKRARV